MSSIGASSTALGSGDDRRVGGAVDKSMSIMIEDLRRKAGSSANILRAVVGLGGETLCVESWLTTDGRSNDQDLTRSNASAWHPTKGMMNKALDVLDKWRLTHTNENARHLKHKIEFCMAGDFAGSFRSLKRLRF